MDVLLSRFFQGVCVCVCLCFVTSSTPRLSQPSKFFCSMAPTRRHHCTTTPPRVLCAATGRSPQPAVAATTSGHTGTPKRPILWPGHPVALAPGLPGVAWASHPILTVFRPQKQDPRLLPGSCPMPFKGKVYRVGGGGACVCLHVRISLCVSLCLSL